MEGFTPDLEALRAAVDAELRRFLDERRGALIEADPLFDEVDRIVGAGGKRLRPAFCYWGFRAAGGSHNDAIVRAATSLEVLHTFAVVHDDIMDRSEERRGVPTVHSLHGVDVALLVGDLALVLADHAFVNCGLPEAAVGAAFEPYSRMRQEVIAGQYLDVVSATRAEMPEEEARRIAVLKSGRYSIEEPLLIGATLAGAGPGWLERIAAFGLPLGEAFQLRDDLLGIFGRRAATGKPVDSDIREGKRNVLYAKAIAALSGEEKHFFVGRWGAPDLRADEIDELRGLVEKSGGRAATEELLGTLTDRARAALAELPTDAEARAALEALVVEATEREL